MFDDGSKTLYYLLNVLLKIPTRDLEKSAEKLIAQISRYFRQQTGRPRPDFST
ncbi:hypothetical protein JWG39_05700 [Desulforhopalus vacuolatus]|uniref:hypothetical protein n=1 Tax=Desulforhopalus vacuolatus TaxID=40414 RepID=UPI00196394D3|nr:hypothetical protein [Desulforhopalus vacuolatus]MBM9519316.1 hypothetical protein [Desulforhopalus vacuolatus]